MTRRYTDDDPDPHGTTEVVRYFRDTRGKPRWLNRFGRQFLTTMVGRCQACAIADRAAARRHRQRTLYRKKRS